MRIFLSLILMGFVAAITVVPQSRERIAGDNLTFVATAYSLRGKMANGQNVHVGAIAADPRILPLGTVVFIKGMGMYTVKDTGGAIKGNRVDIWMSSTRNAMIFGKRKVILKVVSKPTKKSKR